jgi:hypothetical protein
MGPMRRGSTFLPMMRTKNQHRATHIAAGKPLTGSTTTRSNLQSNTDVEPFSAASGASAWSRHAGSQRRRCALSRRPTATGRDIGSSPARNYLFADWAVREAPKARRLS